MIELTPQDVGEFRVLVKKETGKDITNEEAREYALNLVTLVALVAKPELLSVEP